MSAPAAVGSIEGRAGEAARPPKLLSADGLVILAFCLTGFVGFWAYSKAVHLFLHAEAALAAMALSGAAGLLGIGLRYRHLPTACTVLLRGIIGVFLFYSVAASNSLLPEALESKQASILATLDGLHYVALVAGCLGLWRPSLGLPLFLYVFATKVGLHHAFGFSITSTDYIIVLEFAVFVTLSIIILHWAQIVAPRARILHGFAESIGRQNRNIVHFIILMGIAAHFANYYWSAHEKLILDGGVFSWVLENPTHYLVLNTKELGLLPLMISDRLTEWTFHTFGSAVVISNLLTMAIQLLAVVALWRWRWVIWLTACYDVMHVIIYLTTGIFFWKWIALNTLAIIAIRKGRPEQLGPAFHGLACAFVIGAEFLFTIAHLGWYDTNAVNHAYFEAITDEGRVLEVPTNYFLSSSVTFAQQRVGREVGVVVPTGGLGITKKRDMMKAAEACGPDLLQGGLADPDTSPGPIDRVTRMIRDHHRYILSRSDQNGLFDYDLYPHHIWSNPLAFDEFKALDKRRIVAYRWVVDGVCFEVADGRINRHLLGRYQRVIRLDGSSE